MASRASRSSKLSLWFSSQKLNRMGRDHSTCSVGSEGLSPCTLPFHQGHLVPLGEERPRSWVNQNDWARWPAGPVQVLVETKRFGSEWVVLLSIKQAHRWHFGASKSSVRKGPLAVWATPSWEKNWMRLMGFPACAHAVRGRAVCSVLRASELG